jgi:hypothetical protein
MGTQQILLIVLSVIIVGIAIAVGIMMFNNQAYNSNQSAIAGEAQNYAAQVIQWWKTPVSQGGAGQDPANISEDNIAPFIGFTGRTVEGEENVNYLKSENGEYWISGTDDTTVTLEGVGNTAKGGQYPAITTIVTLNPGTVSSTIATDANGTVPID